MLKALLVDDEENNLMSLAFMLTHDCEGIEVEGTAQSSAQAREWLKHTFNQLNVFGGCCGTDEEHVLEIAHQVMAV